MTYSRRRYIAICIEKLTSIGEIPFTEVKDNTEGNCEFQRDLSIRQENCRMREVEKTGTSIRGSSGSMDGRLRVYCTQCLGDVRIDQALS